MRLVNGWLPPLDSGQLESFPLAAMLSFMSITALLLDLDDTLIVEEPLAERAFLIAGELAREAHGVDPLKLHAAVRKRCREVWYSHPAHDYAEEIGISSWEGMWGDLSGDNPRLVQLREWAPQYRLQSWKYALADFGVKDDQLAAQLVAGFIAARRNQHELMPGAIELLDRLRASYARLIMISNGAPGIQRFKLEGSGLGSYFDDVVISGEVGVRKPDPRIFGIALQRAGTSCREAVMIGNSLKSDITGAANAEITSVWLENECEDRSAYPAPDYIVKELSEIPALLSAIA